MVQLNSVLWRDEITSRNKKMIYSIILENIVTYGSETWDIKKEIKKRPKQWKWAIGEDRAEYQELNHLE